MTRLAPITQQRLAEFRRRRNTLLTVRGVSVGLSIVLCAALLLILVDSFWHLSDVLRYIFAFGIYAAAILATLLLVVVPWLRGQSITWLAGQFEKSDPRLEHRLLAAVELSDANTTDKPSFDSAAFRESVQREVAKILESVPVSRALPWRLIGKWLSFSIVLVGTVALLCLIPSLHLPTRLTRILVPMANVGRVSQFAVTLRSPSSDTQKVPENEVIAFEAGVQGSSFDLSPQSVTLELRGTDKAIERVAMRKASSVTGSSFNTVSNLSQESNSLNASESAVANLLYRTNWNVNPGITEYRVVADDASTGWHTLHGVPRPKVDEFEIEYQYPTYASLPPLKTSSPNGNLEAIEGTTAIVSLRVNQPLESALLKMAPKSRGLKMRRNRNAKSDDPSQPEANEVDSKIEFQRVAGSELMIATVPIQENGAYRIELTALDTKLVNAFSPTYSIRAIQDRAPKITWILPSENSISVTPESLVQLSLRTEDELPIASLIQQTRLGSHMWEDQVNYASELSAENTSSSEQIGTLNASSVRQILDTTIDLAMNRVQAGDTFQMRWIATDRKGQTTTSPILDMFVASASLDPSRRDRMIDRLEVAKKVDAVRDTYAAQMELLKKTKETFQSDRDNREKQDALAASAQQLVTETKKSIEELNKQVLETMPKLKDSVSAEEFDRLSQLIYKVRSEPLREVEQLAKQIPREKEGRIQSERIIELVEKAEESINLAQRRSKEFTSHDVLSQIGQDLSTMLRFQQELKESATSMLPEQFRRRQAIVARQFKELAMMTREHSASLRKGADRQAVQWADWMDIQATTIHGITGTDDRPKAAPDSENDRKQLAEKIEAELKNHQQANNIDGGLHDETRNGRKDLRERSSKSSAMITKLADEITKAANEESSGNAKAKESANRLSALIVPSLDQIAHQRTLQQSRNDSDSQWIADLGDAYRAADNIANELETEPADKTKKLKEVAQAMKKLEAIHDLQQVERTLDEMHSTERWKGLSAEAKLEQPRQWDAMRQRLELAVNSLKEAGVSSEIVSNIDKLKWNEAANRIDQKIGPRRWSNEPWLNASEDLKALQKTLRDETKKLADVSAEARANLTELAPSVSVLARNASNELDEAIPETELLAKEIGAGTVPNVESRLDLIQNKLDTAATPLQNLREALSDLASRQDLMKAGTSRIARDADAASEIAAEAQTKISESVADSRTAKDANQKQTSLRQSADTQRDASEALTMIAEHFDALSDASKAAKLAGESEDTNPLAGALAEAAKKMPENELTDSTKKPPLDPNHDEADRLRKLASSNPQRVLAQLEKELPKNTQMQRELSKIARNAVDDSIKTLEYSAKKEQSLEVEVENSDEKFREEKEALRQAIQQSAEIATRVSDTVLPRVRSTSERGQQAGIVAEVDRLRKELRQSIDATRSASTDQSMESIVAAAKSLGRTIESSRRELAQQNQKLEKASSGNIAADEQQLKNRRREMEDWQRSYRDQDINHAQQLENQRKQTVQRAEQKKTEAKNTVQKREKELEEANRRVDEKPEDAGRVAQASRKVDDLEKAKKQELLADEKLQEAERRLELSKARREQLQSDKPIELNANNPHLQLGAKAASAAADQANVAAEILKEALAEISSRKSNPLPPSGSPTSPDERGPNASQVKLKNVAEQQDALENGVEEAAESIARAARHENRMKNESIGEALMQQAKAIREVADGAMTKAHEQLKEAAQPTSALKDQPKAIASGEATLASMESLTTAKKEIEKTAEGLQSAFNEQSKNQVAASDSMSADGQSSKASNSSQSKSADRNNNSKSLLSPQEMARMLDELDQQLAKSKSASEQTALSGEAKGRSSGSPSSDSASEDASDTSERAATLAEATRRLAASMNQQRRESESAKKQSSIASTQPSNSRVASRPGDSSDAVVLGSDIDNDGDWGKLREQTADEASDTVREGIAPAYRKQVDEYFRILSTRRNPTE